MRIIAGICRGKRLKAVKGYSTRPTSDRVKEAVFNVLANKIIDSHFLDLFSGTGNIGLEALSRGAEKAVFVEKEKKALQIIKQNISTCAFEKKSEIYAVDAFMAIKKFAEKGNCFDLIYIDPPYKMQIQNELINLIFIYNLLKENGVIIIETNKNTELKDEIEDIIKVKENIYGDTKITYFQEK